MKKRKNKYYYKAYWIFGLVILLILIYGGINGWFKSNYSITNFINNNMSNPSTFTNDYSGYTNILNLNPTSMCVGDSCIGSLNTNIPNGQCQVFTRTEFTGWTISATVNLDSNGYYSRAERVNTAGTVYFVAICCDKNGNCKISNQASLIVNTCTTPPQPPIHYVCSDSDNGINFFYDGNCQDSFHQLGYSDGCVSGESQAREYYCDDSGICQWIPNPNENCYQGEMTCSSITLPVSQRTCDTGFCYSGACTFVPTHLTSPAGCICSGGLV